MSKRIAELRDLTLSSLAGVTAPAISDELDQSNGYGPYLVVVPVVTGNVTNTDLSVSVGITDENGVKVWSPQQVLTVRTMPDNSVIVDRALVEVFRCQHVEIALESTITGGGSISIYYAFATL